jgi:aminopeptidase C
MTIEGMESGPMNPHISRADRNLVDLYYGGHATQMVGYEVNNSGEIVAFKMQNSWGTEAGRGGYFRMDMSYFRSYIWRLTIRDEKNEFTPEVIASLEKQRDEGLDKTLSQHKPQTQIRSEVRK